VTEIMEAIEIMRAELRKVRELLPDALAKVERDGYNSALTGQADSLFAAVTRATELLPRVESLEVRADLAEALGLPLVITPEEPDPGRDWSRVEGHLFKPGGKWKYRVFLDYTGERKPPESSGYSEPGVGPHGWHFDGAEMAKRALARATANGTSEVTISTLGTYWHLFVPHPPQGYPHWIKPDESAHTDFVDETVAKLDEIRAILAGSGAWCVEVIRQIRVVLDR
jgi:hypothetical protein